jgi:CDP-glycerol glycerophosphotransferase
MRPTLSVVVPMYDVAPFLPAFLESLARQRYEDIEVILVDDGSTDDGVGIAEEWAAKDPRFVVHRFENGGLGRARNRGLALATGDFVAFADPDDLVLEDGYDRMMCALVASGAEMATAPALQFFDGGLPDATSPRYWTTAGDMWDLDRTVHGVAEEPRLVLDHTAWNKVFRRDHLRSSGLSFPVDTTCEDVVPMIGAYLRSTRVDVVSSPVYGHRRREASITSGILSERVVLDWVTQTTAVLDEVRKSTDGVRRTYLTRMLRDEAWTRVSEIDRALTPAASDAVAALVAGMLAAHPHLLDELDARRRVHYELLASGGRRLIAQVEELRVQSDAHLARLEAGLREEIAGLQARLGEVEADRGRLAGQRGVYWRGRSLLGRALQRHASGLGVRR